MLTREQYHVLHFDLRIAGFADLPSLYMSLSQQLEQYFEEIATKMEGYEDFEKEAWSFKVGALMAGFGNNLMIASSTIALMLNVGLRRSTRPTQNCRPSRRAILLVLWNSSR